MGIHIPISIIQLRTIYRGFPGFADHLALHEIGDTQDILAVTPKFFNESGGAAAGSGVGDEDAVRQSADKAIALLGERSRDSVLRRWKRRKDEQTAILEGRLEFGLQMHSDDTPSRNPDDRLTATEQDSQALPFHDRVKAADEYLAFVPHLRNGVESLED